MPILNQLVRASTLVVLATPGMAQKKTPIPPRPPVGADTNSALSYYRLGLSKLEVNAQAAADAFYWALEIEPNWPEALYARRIAVLRADPAQLVRYMRGDKKTRRDFASVDSGYFRALMQDPFVFRDLDRDLMLHYFRSSIEENVRRRAMGQPVDAGALKFEIDRYLSDMMRDDSDPATKAWIAFSERRFPAALAGYAKAIGKKHENPEAHEDRASVFFLTQEYDSAKVEIEHALAEQKQKDDKDRVIVYQPKAMLEFKLSSIHLRQNDVAKAKEALGRALVEDLSFYPAHLALASIALMERDTTTAVRELGLAVELKPTDPFPLLRQAELHLTLRNPDSAVTALAKIVELKPYFATPHRLLGLAADRKGDGKAAVAHFQRYLSLTMKGDRYEAEVRKRIAELTQ